MFAAKKMHAFAVDLVLQIIRTSHNTDDVFTLVTIKDLHTVEMDLHKHWLADNRVQYIKTLRALATTEGKRLTMPDRCCPTVEAAFLKLRHEIETAPVGLIGLVEAKHIADIVWANATNDDDEPESQTLGELLKEQLGKGFPEQ